MSEEQSTDVMDRLNAVLADDAPEVATDEPDEVIEQGDEQVDEQVDEQPEEQAQDETPTEDLVPVEFEGETFQVPAKLKDALLRQQDYTVKTQQVAEQRRAVDDRAQYLEAKEALLGAAYEEATAYRAIQQQLEQFDALDWAKLAQSDMQQAYTLDLQRQELRRQLGTKEQALKAKVAQVEAARKMHMEKQMELGRAEFQRRVGALKAEDVQATWKQGQSLGFTEQELSSLTDARVMHAIWKAAKWDALQAGKSATKQQASKAPPVVRPGATKGASAVAAQQYQKQRQVLKHTGRVEDAARLLGRLIG